MQGSNCNDGSNELTIEKETSLVAPDIVRRNGLSTPNYLMSVTLIEQFPEGNSTASISTTPVSTARLIGIGAVSGLSADIVSPFVRIQRNCVVLTLSGRALPPHDHILSPENPPDLKDSHR
ncbi:hypothetical protein BLNAU_19401 [Blattamonas nauphoetae]|uniref:Uncharacterized protein n=1 Tax=Blattamonas nauphoetae TaxID=2049346 RepID=A0ABQ9X1U6_9EUKA|nr:hypothetical protein BLNAU_19401 [Blattamonas nauphoetae]